MIFLLNPSPKRDNHIRINTETVRVLEDLHVIDQLGNRKRRYFNTLTSLVNRLLLDEIKRERARQALQKKNP